ncbi:MAG TPA: glycine--tRNA ligase, partial [Thermoplasmata archaeon]|nr:glycine--tRNA ligase [Thermoplasmata archaeon]
ALKRQVEEAWVAWFVGLSPDYYRIDPAEIVPEAVVRASGHLENFTDPEVNCASCHSAFRAETVLEKWRPEGVDGLAPARIGELLQEHQVACPNCGKRTLSVPRPFNMMFGLDFGVTGKERVYLRPETAQNSYLAFARMWDVGRKALPLGVAVVGRAFRNEIAPRQVLFRMRGFTQAELQIFFDPEHFPLPLDTVAEEKLPLLRAKERLAGHEEVVLVSAGELARSAELPPFYVYHLAHTYRFFRDVLRYPAEGIRLFEKSDQERAFYNRIQFDVEVRLDSLGGFKELGAVHYRGDYDLGRHAQGSGKDLQVLTKEGRRILPHVLELTFGVDRNLWALADRGLRKDPERWVWSLPPYLAPISAGVFPHLAAPHASVALQVARQLERAGIRTEYDDRGSIGKRYARMDEIGTPWCITVDAETVTPGAAGSGTVTLRERESKAQERVPIDGLVARLSPQLIAPRPPSVDPR